MEHGSHKDSARKRARGASQSHSCFARVHRTAPQDKTTQRRHFFHTHAAFFPYPQTTHHAIPQRALLLLNSALAADLVSKPHDVVPHERGLEVASPLLLSLTGSSVLWAAAAAAAAAAAMVAQPPRRRARRPHRDARRDARLQLRSSDVVEILVFVVVVTIGAPRLLERSERCTINVHRCRGFVVGRVSGRRRRRRRRRRGAFRPLEVQSVKERRRIGTTGRSGAALRGHVGSLGHRRCGSVTGSSPCRAPSAVLLALCQCVDLRRFGFCDAITKSA